MLFECLHIFTSTILGVAVLTTSGVSVSLDHSIYIYQDSKLSEIVVSFVELVQTGLWVVWAEQYALVLAFSPGLCLFSSPGTFGLL